MGKQLVTLVAVGFCNNGSEKAVLLEWEMAASDLASRLSRLCLKRALGHSVKNTR